MTGIRTAIARLGTLVGAACVMLPAAVTAEPAPRAPAWRGGTIVAVSENDEYAFRITVDQHYSNGMRLVWLSEPVAAAPADPLAWAHRIAGAIPGFATRPGTLRLGVALGHNIYTAADTRRAVPDPRDRPYAGWLYGGVALVNDAADRAPGAGVIETLELTLGLVGPSAQGKQLQNFWHGLINYPQAMGWDSQLRDEPGIGLTYARAWRHPIARETDPEAAEFAGLGLDIVPHAVAGLGNVATYAATGAMLRLGTRLAEDYGPPRTRPALAGIAAPAGADRVGGYLFTGFETRLVGRDIFLDGTMFREGPRVDRRPLVTDAMAGLAVTWRDWKASFTYHWRGREFETQGPGDRFGAFSLGARF
jgi:hypothetical protein